MAAGYGPRMRPTKRQRESYKAPYRKAAMPRSLVPSMHSFTRTTKQSHTYYSAGWIESANNVLSSALTAGGGIFRFKLADLPDYTEFTNLYEQFRISKVTLRLLPVIGTDAEAATTTRIIPLAICKNVSALDVATTGVTINDVLSEQGCRVYNGDRPIVISCNPKAYNTVDGASAAGAFGGWLNTNGNGASCEWMGFKWAWETTSPTAYSQYSVYATFYVDCRNPK